MDVARLILRVIQVLEEISKQLAAAKVMLYGDAGKHRHALRLVTSSSFLGPRAFTDPLPSESEPSPETVAQLAQEI